MIPIFLWKLAQLIPRKLARRVGFRRLLSPRLAEDREVSFVSLILPKTIHSTACLSNAHTVSPWSRLPTRCHGCKRFYCHLATRVLTLNLGDMSTGTCDHMCARLNSASDLNTYLPVARNGLNTSGPFTDGSGTAMLASSHLLPKICSASTYKLATQTKYRRKSLSSGPKGRSNLNSRALCARRQTSHADSKATSDVTCNR